MLHKLNRTRRALFVAGLSFACAPYSHATTPMSGTTTFNALYSGSFVDLTGIQVAGSSGLSTTNVAGYDFKVFSNNTQTDAGIGIEPFTGQTAMVYGYSQAGSTMITALEITSNGLPIFDLNSIDISVDGNGASPTITLTGYRNNIAVSGATMSMVLANASMGTLLTNFDVSTNPAFLGIDKIRITTSSSTSGALGVDNINASNFTSTPLPLVLTAFSGRQVGKEVQLDWHTADESGVSSFQIERSLDGQEFETIGSTPAGTAGDHRYYDMAINGKIYYRLKAINEDQNVEYSNIIVVQVNTGVQLYAAPNPVADQTTIYNLPQGVVHYQLFDITGRCVQQGDQAVSANGQLSIRMDQQSSGLYSLILSGTTLSLTPIRVSKK